MSNSLTNPSPAVSCRGVARNPAPGAQQNPDAVAQQIQTFGAAMLRELVANAHKGDWLALTLERGPLYVELQVHCRKLLLALNAGDPAAVTENAADVANLALLAAYCYGDLRS